MLRQTVIELYKEQHEFSAGHFTIFSATEREDLHGHNYSVSLSLQVLSGEKGLEFDYRVYKKKLQAICQTLNRRFLLPSLSPYLKLEEIDDMWIAYFSDEKIPFLKRDVLILPIHNVTLEELSHWFLKEMLNDLSELKKQGIQKIGVKVFNGPGHSGEAVREL